MRYIGIALILLSGLVSSARANSLLRFVCDGSDSGASITVNGIFRGECPLDVQVPAGNVDIRVSKPEGPDKERLFQQTLRMGEDTAKRIEVVLGQPTWTAAGLEKEKQRLAKLEEQRQQAEKLKQQRFDSQLALALKLPRSQGADINNGISYRDCPDCPEMVVVQMPNGNVIAVGKYPIKRAEYAKFIGQTAYRSTPNGERSNICWWYEKGGLFSDSGYRYEGDKSWRDPGFEQGDDHPVVCVSKSDVDAYNQWLTKLSGQNYRLLSWAEWNGVSAQPIVDKQQNSKYPLVTAPISPNSSDVCRSANLFDITAAAHFKKGPSGTVPCADSYTYTSPVTAFPPNKYGLYDLWGNVRIHLQGYYIDDADEENSRKYYMSSLNMTKERADAEIAATRSGLVRGWSWLKGSESVGGYELHPLIGRSYAMSSTGFRVASSLAERE